MKHCRERADMNNRSTVIQKLSMNIHRPINCVFSNIHGNNCYILLVIVSYQIEIIIESLTEFLQHRGIDIHLISKQFKTFAIMLDFLSMTCRRSNLNIGKRLILIT